MLGTSITTAETLDGGRLNGNSTWRSAAEEGRLLKKDLRSKVSDLSRVAKTLDKTAHPDVATQLKMGRPTSYADVIALAINTVAVVTPIKEAFIERGAPATVVEDLQDALDALQAAIGRSSGGRGTRIGKIVELKNAIRQGREQLRILDGILSYALKSSPGLLAEWKAAKRVFRRRAGDTTEPAPVGGSGTTPPSGS